MEVLNYECTKYFNCFWFQRSDGSLLKFRSGKKYSGVSPGFPSN